jgi:hypothetical protein
MTARKYHSHLIEQNKLYVRMLDRLSAPHMNLLLMGRDGVNPRNLNPGGD